MAALQHISTSEVLLLSTQHTVGRSKANLICIPEKDISKTHATIFWDNSQWFLRDHSRNGTKVNGNMVHHTTVELNEGNQLQFGSNHGTTWTFVNANPPSSYLQAVNNPREVIELAFSSLYPNEEKPIISFYLSKTMQWEADNGETTEELEDGEQYKFDNKTWVFVENEPLEDTVDNFGVINRASLDCHLSPDEESVEVKLVINDLELTLGEHVYNYLILLLARKKRQDMKADFADEEQGWMFVEDLLHQLSKELVKEVDVYYFNIMIHRLRKHLKGLKPYGHLFSNIIERKRGKLRLNHSQIRILKSNQEIEY